MKKPTIKGNSIHIPSSQEYLSDVDSFLEGMLRGYGVMEETIADIAISVTEIVNNSIIHGNRSDLDKEVTVSIERTGPVIEIVIGDEGNGFDLTAVQNPVDEENLMREVGRGIFIVRSLMDSVKFEFLPGKGTRVTLSKKIS